MRFFADAAKHRITNARYRAANREKLNAAQRVRRAAIKQLLASEETKCQP